MSENLEITKETSNSTTESGETTPNNSNVLFGTIGYADDTAYETFITNMNLSQAIFVLIASANFSQSRGTFNILESESLATAIRVIRKNSTTEKSSAEESKQ